ncbi:MAG TPA: iron export ABC transporter permease subunit FetB [Acidimicrobiales bacterium]|nr:iron export ABC transporter permease subunit FetB [Acidimicrobiales bacterium]
MGDSAIGWGGLSASLLLVVVAIGLSAWRRLGLEATIAWACARAMGQLLLVGYALAALIDDDAPASLAWAWVVAMVAFAAVTVRRRTPEVPGAFSLALVATGSSAALSLAVVFGLEIYDAVPRAIIPIAGMMVGNSISGTVTASRQVIAELADHRLEVEARLALGQPWTEASRRQVRAALRTALMTQIESTKAVGLVFLPGAMTGLILAGADPVDAVLVQAAVMFLILGAVATNATIVGLGLARRLFSSDHRLLPLARSTA